MEKNTAIRLIISFVAGACHGLLLAWVLTFERDSSNQILGFFLIIVLLLFFHFFSSRLLSRSIYIIYSYYEGILFFTITMAAFRIGDHRLDITNISLMTELWLIGLGVLTGSAYVWAMKRVYKK
jgi:hypothetical protein